MKHCVNEWREERKQPLIFHGFRVLIKMNSVKYYDSTFTQLIEIYFGNFSQLDQKRAYLLRLHVCYFRSTFVVVFEKIMKRFGSRSNCREDLSVHSLMLH